LWKKDALLFVISGIISNTLYLITGFYNEEESIITIVGFSYSFFFPLFLASFCRYIRPTENKKQKYSRWYTICYFVFCICSIFIYTIGINIGKNISDSKEKSNNLKYFYLLFLIIGLIFALIILRKKGYFYSIFTVSILILEVVVLILKLITIILTHLYIKSKYPLIIIPEIIIFIIDVLLNINLLKDEIKNCMNIFMKSDIKINLIWESTNSKTFEVKINNSEKFHDVIIKFIKKNHKLFKCYIIKEMYISNSKNKLEKDKTTNINSNSVENNNLNNHSNNSIAEENNNIINENNNIINENDNAINENNDIRIIDYSPIESNRVSLKNEISKPHNKASEIDKKIIETEEDYEYKTFKELNLVDNTKIFFETRDTRDENEEEKVENEKQKFKDNGLKINNKLYFIFKLEGEEYPLFIDKNLKLEDTLLLFQKEYYSFIDSKIKEIEYDGKNIWLEKDKSIEELKLKEGSVINVSIYDDDEEISEIKI